MTTPHKIQSVAALAIVAVGVTFILLNQDPAEVNFLFGTFSVSRAWLVIGFFAAGLLVGWLTHSLIVHFNQSKKASEAEALYEADD